MRRERGAGEGREADWANNDSHAENVSGSGGLSGYGTRNQQLLHE